MSPPPWEGSFTVLLVIVAAACLQELWMALATWENVRFFRRRLRSPAPDHYCPPAEVFMPCKGLDAAFDASVAALLDQDYPDYRVTFVVESAQDPAHARLRALLGRHRGVPARILVAGEARACGQKVHNLLVATAATRPEVEVLAFVDSDALPARDWLRRLVHPLHKPAVGAVTGYRWFLPERLAGVTVAAVNAGVAFLLGGGRFNQVWGGTWATRRATFDVLRSMDIWHGALTEDLQIAPAVRRLAMRVSYEPSCLVASPVRGSWQSLVEFGRRQYLIARVYAPLLWCTALAGNVLYQAALWGGLAAFCARPEGPGLLAGAGAAGLYLLSAARAALRQAALWGGYPQWRPSLRAAALLDIFAPPLVGLVRLSLLLASAFGRTITWRGIRYRLDGPNQTAILHRPEAQRQAKAA